MNDEKISERLIGLMEQTLNLNRDLLTLRASVNVLKTYIASLMCPDDPSEGLKQLRLAEKVLLDADPNVQESEKAAQLIQAAKLWKKTGGRA
jgi:hypothetical protein